VSGSDVTFNVQQFLNDMRRELREDNQRVSDKVEQGIASANDVVKAVADRLVELQFEHYNDKEALATRVTTIEQTVSLVRWASRTVIAAALVGGVDAAMHIFGRPVP